jgi:hypothetical protein
MMSSDSAEKVQCCATATEWANTLIPTSPHISTLFLLVRSQCK